MKISDADRKKLQDIYNLMPETTCLKTGCALACCTKKEQPMDSENNFMPLPMVYGIEFLNILEHLKREFPNASLEEIYDFSLKNRLCPFKDKKSFKCLIYPVRPFSCRLFGRKVLPVIWGVEVSKEMVEGIYCPDMRVDEIDKIELFNSFYRDIWDQLAIMTMQNPPFSNHAIQIIEKVTGMPGILIMGFGEFFKLYIKEDEWWEDHFADYWRMKGDLI